MQEIDTRYPSNKSPLLRVLRFISRLLPGEYLKTGFYVNAIDPGLPGSSPASYR
jgi:hypothetical protein